MANTAMPTRRPSSTARTAATVEQGSRTVSMKTWEASIYQQVPNPRTPYRQSQRVTCSNTTTSQKVETALSKLERFRYREPEEGENPVSFARDQQDESARNNVVSALSCAFRDVKQARHTRNDHAAHPSKRLKPNAGAAMQSQRPFSSSPLSLTAECSSSVASPPHPQSLTSSQCVAEAISTRFSPSEQPATPPRTSPPGAETVSLKAHDGHDSAFFWPRQLSMEEQMEVDELAAAFHASEQELELIGLTPTSESEREDSLTVAMDHDLPSEANDSAFSDDSIPTALTASGELVFAHAHASQTFSTFRPAHTFATPDSPRCHVFADLFEAKSRDRMDADELGAAIDDEAPMIQTPVLHHHVSTQTAPLPATLGPARSSVGAAPPPAPMARPTMQLVPMTVDGLSVALSTLISTHESVATAEKARADHFEKVLMNKDTELANLRRQLEALKQYQAALELERKTRAGLERQVDTLGEIRRGLLAIIKEKDTEIARINNELEELQRGGHESEGGSLAPTPGADPAVHHPDGQLDTFILMSL